MNRVILFCLLAMVSCSNESNSSNEQVDPNPQKTEINSSEKSKSLEVVMDSLSSKRYLSSSWLEWDESQMVGKFMNVPERADIPEDIKEQLIVELYSK